jgi:Rhodopirellula transposase DDE domain
VTAINAAAEGDPAVVRVSMDATATVTIGPVSRRGTSRVPVPAADHDVHPTGTVTPVGSVLPEWDERCSYQVIATVTSDCLVDRRCPWWDAARDRVAPSSMRVLTRDNGPEHHRQRTHCIARVVRFVAH